jgi:hypothetical protein
MPRLGDAGRVYRRSVDAMATPMSDTKIFAAILTAHFKWDFVAHIPFLAGGYLHVAEVADAVLLLEDVHALAGVGCGGGSLNPAPTIAAQYVVDDAARHTQFFCQKTRRGCPGASADEAHVVLCQLRHVMLCATLRASVLHHVASVPKAVFPFKMKRVDAAGVSVPACMRALGLSFWRWSMDPFADNAMG